MKFSRTLSSVGTGVLLALLAPLAAAGRPVPGAAVPPPSSLVRPPSFAGAHAGVASITSAPTAAGAGHSYLLHGTVAAHGSVVVRLLRVGSRPVEVGRTSIRAAAHASGVFGVHVRLPRALRAGSYALV